METYPHGHYLGKNFVFDKRVEDESSILNNGDAGGTPSPLGAAGSMGVCLGCSNHYDTYSGTRCCTVCRTPLLMCNVCVENNPYKNEYWCSRHQFLRNIYFTVLEPFTIEQLRSQDEKLGDIGLRMCSSTADKNRRRTIRRQREKIAARYVYLLLLYSFIHILIAV